MVNIFSKIIKTIYYYYYYYYYLSSLFLIRHRWLHSMTDHTPIDDPPPHRKFYLDQTVNKTGTVGEYVPYSTTRPKIQSWKPPQQ